MWWQFCYVFLLMEGFFSHNLYAFFALFFPCRGFLLRLSPYGALFSPFKSLSATFISMLGLFCYVFLPYGGLFFTIRRPFCYVFLLLGGLFHHLKAFLLLFFSMWRPFCYVFLVGGGGGFFPPFEGHSVAFFLHVGVLFLFLWGTFLACPPPPPKFRRGLMPACPLTPMSNMQHSHSLTASCHFRDILKIVTNYFLIYIFAWLTIFKIRKRNEDNIF